MRQSVALFELKVNNTTFRSKQQSSLSSSRIKRTQSTRWSPWKEIKATSSQIKCRCHHASVLVDNKLFVYGGFDNDTGIIDDFKMFQIPDDKIQNQSKQKGTWVSINMIGGPGARHSHTAAFHDGLIYIFGGKVDRFKNTNTLYSYSIKQNKWSLVETFDIINQKKENKEDVKTGASAIAVNFKSKKNINREVKIEQKKNQSKPEGIDSHQAVVLKDQMIIYGGFTNNKFTNNVYSLNLKTKIWKKLYSDQDEKEQKVNIQYPQARGDFSMVEYKNCLYIYGGKNLNKSFNDLWEFNLSTLKFKQISDKNSIKLQNRSGHSAIVYKDYMLIFGGILSVTHQRDDLLCYQFNTGRWLVIWNNSEIKGVISENKLKKSQSKKLSNNPKGPQNNICLIKSESQEQQKPGKYRRPIIEEKKGTIKREQKTERDRYKKNNERKINLLNQIQTAIKPYQHMPCQRYSPLIQSLNNSIMITSSSHQSGINSKDINYNTSNIFKEQKLNRSSLIEGQYYKEKKLKPRDGHTAHLYNDEMVIFGGDRHKIALNDIVFISLQVALQNKHMRVVSNQSQLFLQTKNDKLAVKISE